MEALPEEESGLTTIARVAALAGVGVGTVSRVLNDSGAVSPATRRRVQEAIDALDYEPSAAARALSTGRTLAVGVVAPFATRPSVVERLRGIARRIADSGYQLVLLDVDRPGHFEGTLRSVAVKSRFDGLLVISLPLPESAVARVRSAGIPLVLVDRHEPGLSGVHIDDRAGGRLAAEHLLGLGHARIGFLGDVESNPYGFDSSARRRTGFETALHAAGVGVDRELVLAVPYGREAARTCAEQLLALPTPPTAIFAASDDQAVGVLDAANAVGVSVPDDLSVVGFDDIEIARYVGLTTVAQPLEESGSRSVELLFEALGGWPARSEELRCELVVRETTAAARASRVHTSKVVA
jgi:LacI family transcriptional regulator, galactose operon repressor